MTKKFIDNEIKGMDKVQKKLKDLGKKSRNLSFDKIFNNKFMRKYTKYSTLNDFVIASGLVPKDTTIVTDKMFLSIPDKPFDDYIRKTTRFKSWKHMQQIATSEYLGFN